MLGLIVLLSLVLGSAYGGFNFGACPMAQPLQNFTPSIFAGKTWYVIAEIPMTLEKTDKMCQMLNVSTMGSSIVMNMTYYNMLLQMPTMINGVGMMNNNMSNSYIFNMTYDLDMNSFNMIDVNYVINYKLHCDIIQTDNMTYALVHTCMDFMGLASNDGYVLIASTPTLVPRAMQLVQEGLVLMNQNVSQMVMYNNTNCSMMMNSTNPMNSLINMIMGDIN